GIGTSGGSSRNCVQPSLGPAWKQVKFVPRTICSFAIVHLLFPFWIGDPWKDLFCRSINLYIQLLGQEKSRNHGFTFDPLSFLAALLSRVTPSSPSSSMACRCASSQAGTAFSISRFP